MKLRLPKMLLVAVVVGFAVSPAMADYVWQGGDTVSADNWNVSENWELTGSTTYPTGGNGPATPNSGGFDRLVIAGASGTTANLEGWAFHLSLGSHTADGATRCSDITAYVKKLQGGCSIEIGSGSSLTLHNGVGGAGNDGGDVDVTLNGTFNLVLCKNLGVNHTNIAYGDISDTSGVGCFNLSSNTAGTARTASEINLGANIAGSVISDTLELHSVTLMTYSSDITLNTLNFNITTTDSSFINAGSRSLSATEGDVGKYSVVNDNGTVTLYYVTGQESMLGKTWALQEGEGANWSEQGFGGTPRLTLNVTATESAEDAAVYNIDSDCSLDMLTVNGGAARVDIQSGSTLELGDTHLAEGASLSYTGAGNLVLHSNTSVAAVNTVTGSLTIDGATLSISLDKETTFALAASELILENGATFSMFSQGHAFTQKVTMDGGTVYVEDGSGDSFAFNHGIKVGSGGAAIISQWDKHFNLGTGEEGSAGVEGSGTLTLSTTNTLYGRATFNLNNSIADGVNVEVSDSILNIGANGSFGSGTLKLLSSTPANANKVAQVNLSKDATLKFETGSKGVVNVDGHTLTATLGGDMAEGFRFTGTGAINLSGSAGVSLIGSTNEALRSTFTGTINICTDTNHIGVKGSGQLFNADAAGNYASLNFKSGTAGKVFGIGGNYTETNALKIGNLTSEHSNIEIRGDWDHSDDVTRYLEVHQTLGEATFSGIFATASNNRNVGLIKEGVGNLVLTGNNTSNANLFVKGGTVTVSGDSARWTGSVIVGETPATDDGGASALAEGGSAAGPKFVLNGKVGADSDSTAGITVNSGTLETGNSAEVLGSGNVTIGAAGTLLIGSEAAGLRSSLSVGGTLTLSDGATVDVSNLSLTENEVVLATASVIDLGNISLVGAANYTAKVISTTGYTAMQTNALVLVLDASVSLTATAVGTSYAEGAPYGTLNIDVEGFDFDSLAGKDLAVSVGCEAWAAIVEAMNGEVYQNATITLNGQTLDNFGTVSFNGYTGEASGEYFVAYIPEPATATLSLLALAALAARRRRK